MGIISSNKIASKQSINAKESFDVTLSLEAEPNIRNNPKDIIVIMDKSNSMAPEPMVALKEGVCYFADVIAESTSGMPANSIKGGSHIGIVSFSSTATLDLPLSTSVAKIKQVANSIKTGGTTFHADAYTKAVEALSGSVNDKVIVMFTDGNSATGSEGFDITTQAKADGIEIYCMGFSKTGTLDMEAFKKWASEPTDDHILVTPNYNDIKNLFETLAGRITEPGATGIEFTDRINPCFNVTTVNVPDKGNAIIVDNHTVKWTIDKLGDKKKEVANFVFTVQHNGSCKGVQPVNKSFYYKDNEANTITLPSPNIEILSDDVVDVYEDCPTASDLDAEGCSEYITYDAGNIVLDNIGRIVEVSTTIKNVCPNKKVALAAILTELDDAGEEYDRGMKTLVIPPHEYPGCMDVKVNCIKFILPEAVDMTGDPTSMCNNRKFRVRFIANYLDSDYKCCGVLYNN